MIKKELLASFLVLVLLAGGLLSTTPLALASTEESTNEESNEDTGEGSEDEGSEPPPDDTTPPPDGIEEPPEDTTPGPIEDFTQPVIPVVPGEPEPELFRCPDDTLVESEDDCPIVQLPLEPIANESGTALEELANQLGLQYPSPNPLEDLQDLLENITEPGDTPPEVDVNVTLPEEPVVEPGDNYTDPGDNQTDPDPEPCDENSNSTCPLPPGDNKTIIIKKIIKNINVFKSNTNSHGHSNFPDIDIIGLSTKDNGDSIMCLMDIDSDHIQCQEFGMDPQRVNSDFWRVIETDHDKDYDNGNTGSSDIDDAIEDIKSQDFSELEDADNHDFGIDLGWVAINPQGDGVTCVTTDQSGKGKSLCEPFAIGNEDVDGQITEGFQFEN